MGEVYKARDTRLDRAVAVKILPAELAQNAQFKIRFEREAKTISQLSHPNICALFDVGENYLVMELLDGESLTERLAKGPLPLSDVLKYGVQIAEALDKAHRAGVIHRDLKPGNIMLTKSGAKLLDFGLAKSGAFQLSVDGATQQKPLTQEGTILGTFQYMAPEQLEGLEADARTDIFALGVVLYEMATGHRAFEGKTKTSLIAAIVSGTPRPLSEVQQLAPPALDHVITKCLEKDPDDRWQNAHDIAGELRWISDAGKIGVAHVRRQRVPISAVGVSFVLGVILTALGLYALRSRFIPHRPVTRLTISTPPGAWTAAYGARNPAISPSGRVVAYIGDRSGTSQHQLYIRKLDSLETIAVPGTEDAASPFFSPDSQWIGFGAGNYLQKVSVDGGTPQPICEASDVRGASWKGDTIAFAAGTAGVSIVAASGGKPRVVVPVNPLAGEDGLFWPELLPDAETLLFSSFHGTKSEIVAFSLRTGKRIPILAQGSRPRFVNGYLFFARGASLLAVPFDEHRLHTTSAAIPLLDGIYFIPPYNGSLYDIAEDGTLLYASGSVAELKRSLVWVDASGRTTPIPLPFQPYEEPRLSPDGAHVAVAARTIENADIWNVDLARSTVTRVTFDPGEDETAMWSRDGQRIAFAASRAGRLRSIYWRRADGVGGEEQLLSAPMPDGHPHMSDFSPDGQFLAYTNFQPGSDGDIWIMSMLNGVSRPFVRTVFNERAPRFSPDGKYIAYTSSESGRDEIYVQSFPGPGGKWQISNEGGREVVWSPTGKQLFYRSGDKMMVSDIDTKTSFRAVSPRVLFTGQFVPTRRGEAAYDVTKDGTKFLMVQRDENGPQPSLIVVLDGFDDLQRRLRRGTPQ
jgi:Tol biopolymer transport system component